MKRDRRTAVRWEPVPASASGQSTPLQRHEGTSDAGCGSMHVVSVRTPTAYNEGIHRWRAFRWNDLRAPLTAGE